MALNIGLETDSGVITNYHKILGVNWGGEYITESKNEQVLDGNGEPLMDANEEFVTKEIIEFVLDEKGDKIPEVIVLVVSYLDKDTRDNNKKALVGKEYRTGISINDTSGNFIALAYKGINENDNFVGASEV